MLTETWVVFQRAMRMLLRNPVWVFFGLTQPILYLVLFGPLLKNVTGGGLGGNASWAIFVPGLLLQLVVFTGGFAGFGIIQELREGVIDRQRVTPASRVALTSGAPCARRSPSVFSRSCWCWWLSPSGCTLRSAA
jgi:ABC-2 type transport system permease protein